MRSYTLVNGAWTEISTDSNGFDDAVWLTTLLNCIQLSIGESPFFANYGIPAQQSIVTQVQPDFYISQLQSQFAQFFSSLQIIKQTGTRNPTYQINVITNQGAKITALMPVTSGALLDVNFILDQSLMA